MANLAPALKQANPVFAQTTLADRRASFRIEVHDGSELTYASALLITGEAVEIDVANFSFAGALFYTAPHAGLTSGAHIPKIHLEFRNKPTIELSGQIVRLQTSGTQVFCGVSFYQDASNMRGKAHSDPGAMLAEQSKIYWLQRLEQLSPYKLPDLPEEEQEKRQDQAYASFAAVSANFNTEERWWFYEMLEELQRNRAGGYPEALLEEFIKACECGFHRPIEADSDRSTGALMRWWSILRRLLLRRPA